MYYATKYKLLPGDRVTEAIFLTGLSKHHAIYLGMDLSGTEWIAENHHIDGVRLATAGNYFHPAKNYTVIAFRGKDSEREAAVKRALDQVGARYDLVNYNCEHYASYMQTGKAQSNQVKNVLLAAGGALLLLFLTGASKPKK